MNKFEDASGIIRSRKSVNRQFNGQKRKKRLKVKEEFEDSEG